MQQDNSPWHAWPPLPCSRATLPPLSCMLLPAPQLTFWSWKKKPRPTARHSWLYDTRCFSTTSSAWREAEQRMLALAGLGDALQPTAGTWVGRALLLAAPSICCAHTRPAQPAPAPHLNGVVGQLLVLALQEGLQWWVLRELVAACQLAQACSWCLLHAPCWPAKHPRAPAPRPRPAEMQQSTPGAPAGWRLG